jgi:hypothetical protein
MGNTGSTLTIPKYEELNIDRSKINKYIIYAFNNCIDNNTDDGKPCVIITPSHGLTPDELDIAKGIILVNGLTYWETDTEL